MRNLMNGTKTNKGKGFDNYPGNINKNGRPPSFKVKLEEMFSKDGDLVIKSTNVKDIKENGDVVIGIPTKDKILFKALSIAMSDKPEGARMIQWIIEHLEGKATQNIGIGPIQEYKPTPEIIKLLEQS